MRRKWLFLCIAVCVITSLACSLSGGKSTPEATPPTATLAAPVGVPTAKPSPTAAPPTAAPTATSAPPMSIPIPPDADKGNRQWAIAAAASSEFGDPDHSAIQATGAPDTLACGDFASAWAAFDASGVEWIELSYGVPTVPTLINIIETHYPSQIVKVELIDTVAGYHEIYTVQPTAVNECPYTLSIPVDVAYQVSGLRITVDHSVLGLGQNQIDAVEVIGSVERITIPEATTAAEALWRVGGSSELLEIPFTIVGGMDATDAALYIADAYNGVYVYDLEGNYQGQLAQGEIGYVADVKVGPSGEVYMADLGLRQVARFNADGDLLGAFGAYGTGDGEFSGDSPAALAVGPDGSVYALDLGDAGARVQVFTAEGDFIRKFAIEEDLGLIRAMDVGPDGTLYLIGYAGYILGVAPDDGRVLAHLGEDALGDAFPQMMSVDDAGNFYVATQIPAGAVKLDSQGTLLETFGVEGVNDGETGWSEGEFMFPVGIAVTGDGHYIFIGDGIGEFSFVTAYRYP
jgi:hypothetical protein